MRALFFALLLLCASAAFAADTPGQRPPEAVGGTGLTDAAARLRALLDAAEPAACCKVCSKGKACGDSCIKRSYTCHKGPGCACDAY